MTISLSADLEKRIREKVDAGTAPSVDAFVDIALRQVLGMDASEVPNQKPLELDLETDEFFAAIDRHLPPDTPLLPADALSRDAIYEDRG